MYINISIDSKQFSVLVEYVFFSKDSYQDN
jgi:hypothetical protein